MQDDANGHIVRVAFDQNRPILLFPQRLCHAQKRVLTLLINRRTPRTKEDFIHKRDFELALYFLDFNFLIGDLLFQIPFNFSL